MADIDIVPYLFKEGDWVIVDGSVYDKELHRGRKCKYYGTVKKIVPSRSGFVWYIISVDAVDSYPTSEIPKEIMIASTLERLPIIQIQKFGGIYELR